METILKKMQHFFTILTVLLTVTAAYAYDTSSIKAYPVPFNPKQGSVLSIDVPASYRVTLTVYDINGDRVTERSYASATSPITWSGRNSRGRIVKPGLYILMIIVENDTNGDYGKKLLRILVKY